METAVFGADYFWGVEWFFPRSRRRDGCYQRYAGGTVRLTPNIFTEGDRL